ncbi:MAG: outer-membrane lipoprotein carrier protein LolA [Terriglobia bacterium]
MKLITTTRKFLLTSFPAFSRLKRWPALHTILLLFFLTLGPSNGLSADVSPELKKVFDRIDHAGKTIVDLTAAITQKKVTLVVNDTSIDNGKLWLKRTKNGNRTRLDYTSPEVKTLLIDKGKVWIYEPKLNRLQEIELGKNRDQAEFMLVGLGQSSSDLLKTYDVKYLTEESINSSKTSLIELKPKSSKTAAMFTKISLWIDYANGIPIQTQLTEASGDYLTLQLEALKINPDLTDKDFKLKLPPGVEKITPMKSK